MRVPVPRRSLPILAGVAAYVAARPVLGLGHELVVVALAQLGHLVAASGIWEPLIRLMGLDPIYAGAAVQAAGGVEVAGLALAGPIGAGLHLLLPAAFLDPRLVADGAGVSMVAVAGAPALGRGLAAFGADIVWLVVGLALFWYGRRSNWILAVLGLFIQAQIAVNHLLDARVSLADVDASGLPFALALAIPPLGWVTGHLTDMAPEPRDVLLSSILLVVGFVAAALVFGVVCAASALVRQVRRGPRSSASSSPPPRSAVAALTLGLAIATACSPVGALAVGQSNWQLPPGLVTAPSPAATSARPGRLDGVSHTVRVQGATRVDIAPRDGGGWQYLVDGVPDTIRGVGYNPQYAALPTDARAARYQRDFSEMRRAGINTIEGWFEGQFDSVTLDYAARNGIGVLMPFELNQDWPYDNPNVQQSILDHVSAYVEKYRNNPAVRMWAPGNENLHRILYARWISQENDPAARARAEAFAAFLPRLVDRIHELDPDHPVLYRDAEDAYLGRITSAFEQAPGERPWLVYGANVYATERLRQIIGKWPSQWPGRPLLISEFAPGGVGPTERPFGFQQQWGIIRSRPDVVLGGIAYTWATNGPEDLDRVFGLVNPEGVPTDGALVALSQVYTADALAASSAPG